MTYRESQQPFLQALSMKIDHNSRRWIETGEPAFKAEYDRLVELVTFIKKEIKAHEAYKNAYGVEYQRVG